MFAIHTTHFDMDQPTSRSWWDLRSSIRTKLAQLLPIGVFDKYYRCFQMFLSNDGKIYQRATERTRIRDDTTIIVVPATRLLSKRYNELGRPSTNQGTEYPSFENVSSYLDFTDWSVRYESLKAVFRSYHSQEKAIELANLGLHGVENCGNAALIQCCHCYGISMVDIRSTAEAIRVKHIKEFRTCPIKDSEEVARTTWKAETNENFYKQQTMVLSKQLIDTQIFYEAQISVSRAKMQNFKAKAREPDRDDKGNFKCLLCLSERASVIALPCLHLCLCSRCFLAAKSHNNNVPPKCIYCNDEPEYYSKVFGEATE